MIKNFPFMLSLSKHSDHFSATYENRLDPPNLEERK
jgi:hypothetical protein